jgi:glucose-6-phosphate dehydrogenase assembly protein OpcA
MGTFAPSEILEALHDGRSSGGHGPSACVATLNFVVFVDDSAHREWVLGRALRVVAKHPARLIVLDATGATCGADVSCSRSEADSATVVCERIDLGVETLEAAEIVHVTRVLLQRDIPTVVWWSGARLLASGTFQGLAELADAVVVDSSGCTRDAETIRELGEFVARFPNAAFHDLAFLRLAPWREMIARIFDDPDVRDDLFALRSLEIHSGSEAEALYLGAWLASCISWKGAGPATFLTGDGSSVRFTRMQKGDARRVLRVTLSTGDSTFVAAVSTDNEGVVQLSVAGAKARPDSFVPLHRVDNPSLIEHAILTVPDPVFEATLATVRELFASA